MPWTVNHVSDLKNMPIPKHHVNNVHTLILHVNQVEWKMGIKNMFTNTIIKTVPNLLALRIENRIYGLHSKVSELETEKPNL